MSVIFILFESPFHFTPTIPALDYPLTLVPGWYPHSEFPCSQRLVFILLSLYHRIVQGYSPGPRVVPPFLSLRSNRIVRRSRRPLGDYPLFALRTNLFKILNFPRNLHSPFSPFRTISRLPSLVSCVICPPVKGRLAGEVGISFSIFFP